jgi:hypothetical protein
MNLEQRGNLIIRIKAMEEEAQNKGYEATFFTVTSPHKNDASVKQTVKRFNVLFSQIRAHLKRRNVDISGIRVTEPQPNGNPRFFILIFSDPKQAVPIKKANFHFLTKNKGFHITQKTKKDEPQQQIPDYLERTNYWAKLHQIRLITFFGQPTIQS